MDGSGKTAGVILIEWMDVKLFFYILNITYLVPWIFVYP